MTDDSELEWEVELLSGGMQMQMQKLVVPRRGNYFVYSQIQFDPEISGKAAGHLTKVNGRVVLGDEDGTEGGQYYTRVLQLMAGDQISVAPAKKKRRIMQHLCHNASFFGAFWVHPDTMHRADEG